MCEGEEGVREGKGVWVKREYEKGGCGVKRV